MTERTESTERIMKLIKELPDDYKKITLWIIHNQDFFYKMVKGCSIADIQNAINRADENDTRLLETLILFKIACET